jgi:hypothetical protein
MFNCTLYSRRNKYSGSAEEIAIFLTAITFDTDVLEGSIFFFLERYWSTGILVLRTDKPQKSSLVFLPGTSKLTLKKRPFLTYKKLYPVFV